MLEVMYDVSMTTDECIMYDEMVEYGIATPEEINLVKNCKGGTWTETFNSICYVRTGNATWKDFLQELMESED